MTKIQDTLNNTILKSVILDVRGTLIHPTDDTPVSTDFAQVLVDLLKVGIIVAINTATSIESLEQLLIAPMRNLRDQTVAYCLDKFPLYIDSSSAAYQLNQHWQLMPLPRYDSLIFSHEGIRSIRSVIDLTKEKFNLRDASVKVKPGQVNFYSGGTWETRVQIAAFMREHVQHLIKQGVAVMVPTAKDTIDIAMCQKSRGVVDMLERYHLLPEHNIIIGDSMQTLGADHDMWSVARKSLGVQVGAINPPAEILHSRSSDAPMQTLSILQMIRSHALELNG